jgi:CYTH domain-containing protein
MGSMTERLGGWSSLELERLCTSGALLFAGRVDGRRKQLLLFLSRLRPRFVGRADARHSSMREAHCVPIQRLFVIAPSLARLIRQERGGEPVIEGYFPDQPQRGTFVQIDESRSSLILKARADEATEERADIPPAHAQALLAVSQGQVEYLRTSLSIGSHEIQVFHVLRPGPLELVAIQVAPEDDQDFPPPPWFGPEVSAEPAYQRRRLALKGAPEALEVDVTNAALNHLLDLLEDRFSTWPGPHQATISDAAAVDVTPRPKAPAPEPEPEVDEAIDDLHIEDGVIRELARSLQPRRSG